MNKSVSKQLILFGSACLILAVAFTIFRSVRSNPSPKDSPVRQIEDYLERASSDWIAAKNRLEQVEQSGTPDQYLDSVAKEVREISSQMQRDLSHRQLPSEFKEACFNYIEALNQISCVVEEHPHIPKGYFDLHYLARGFLYGVTFDFDGPSRDMKRIDAFQSEILRLKSAGDDAETKLINCAIKFGAAIPDTYW